MAKRNKIDENLGDETKGMSIHFKYDIKHLEIIPKRMVSTLLMGNYRSIFRGRGMEFEDFRPFVFGDDARLIDWKASLKTGSLLIKEFMEERNLNVFFIFDVSSKMCVGSIEKFKNEYAAEFIASIAYAVMQVGDTVGLGMFSDDIVFNIFPDTGPKQFYSIRKALVDPANYGGGYNIDKALKYFDQHLPKGSMVMIVSDFIGVMSRDDVSEFEILLKTLAKKYDIIGVMVRDVRDSQLPRGVGNVLISDPHTGEEVVINPDEIGSDYEDFVKAEEEELRRMFLRSGADMMLLETDKSFIRPVLRFFRRRTERLR